MENLNDESLRKLFKESGSRAIDNEPDIWFTRRVVSRLPRRSSIPGRIAWGVFIVVCIVAFGVYVDYVRLFMQTRDLHTLIGASVCLVVAAFGIGLQMSRLQVSVFIEKSLLYNCARGFFDGETYHSQPRTTSRIIIRANPMANPMVPVLLCFPVALSGISSSTTT